MYPFALLLVFRCREVPKHYIMSLTPSDAFRNEVDPRTYFIVAYNLILTVPILVGNMLIILVFGLYSSVDRRHSHMFIINIAVSDFIVGLILPFDATFYLVDYIRFEKYACFVRFTVFAGALGQSIFSLAAISLDRFIAIFFLWNTSYMWREPEPLCFLSSVGQLSSWCV